MGAEPVHRLVPPAEVDAVTAGEFADLFEGIPATATALVDCSRVEFMDSSGLAVLVRMSNLHTAAGGTVTVVSPSPAVARLLAAAGLEHLLSAGGGGQHGPDRLASG